ncbi:MAG: dihydropteroate synthase [Lachnospiraceae bacterium]|nr:dihydropteroate synthase [Lachnospiraceae bacterium]
MKIGNRIFDTANRTYVMGILNVTPDSFSDGGKYTDVDIALKKAEEMMHDGADIIDIGGESTKPGYVPVGTQEEIERVIPVIEKIKANLDIPVSLDTYKAEVAKAGIAAGADLINDVKGLQESPEMAKIIADGKVACAIMHNRTFMNYNDFFSDMQNDLSAYIETARNAGIADDKIIIDPGVGFAKTHEQNLEVINRLEQFHCFGYPILLGTSRKSVIGLTLDLPVFERVEGTLVTTVMAVMKGCSFVRVHDVKENVRAIRMTEAILGKR